MGFFVAEVLNIKVRMWVVCLVLMAPSLALAQFERFEQVALAQNLQNDPQWLRLLHIKNSSPQVDGPNFYLQQKNENLSGKTSASFSERELIATLRAFYETPGEDSTKHAVCRFPLRLRFLSSRIKGIEKELPKIDCKTYRTFKTRIAPKKASLVFSSFYMGSASSTFGHTFLKFSGENENELFDTGINFAANPTTQNPILYALFGAMGKFPGSFSAMPYYMKVREYSDYERRDLWVYDLALSPEEIEDLLDHLWELGETFFDYFYFSENCSYQIVDVLNVVVPHRNLTENLPFYVIPSDSVRKLYENPGLVQAIRYRPSVAKRFYEQTSKMTGVHVKEFNDLVLQKRPVSSEMLSKVSVVTLDAYLDFLEMQGEPLEDAQAVRAKMPEVSSDVVVAPKFNEAPHEGHSPRRLGFGVGQSRLDLDFKFAMHDLLDPGYGYAQDLHIDFGRLGLGYEIENKRLYMNRIELFGLTSLAPVDAYFSKWSYRAEFGFYEDVRREVRLAGGLGKSIKLFSGERFSSTLFGMVDFAARFWPGLEGSNFQPTVGPRAGWVFYVGEKFRAKWESALAVPFFTNTRNFGFNEMELRYSGSKKFAYGLFGRSYFRGGQPTDSELGIRAFYYAW